jgi:putative PIN family toxin of toxin-antitoxin system
LDVLQRPYLAAVTAPSFHDGLAKMLEAAELVLITERITACRDPRDDKFLELAVNGHADLIVSGDRDLLALNPFRDIPIVTPADFVQRVSR